MIARWFGILAELDFDIVFRPGAQSVVADALGRRPADRVDVATQTDDPTVRGVSALPCSSSYLKEQRDLDVTIAEVTRFLSAGVKPRGEEE